MKVLTYIFYTIFFILVAGALLLFASPKLPYLGEISVKIVKSGSMEPTINTGGVVVIRGASAYQMGDVITFTSAGANIPTTHRIIGTEMKGEREVFVTKGDANEERDTQGVYPEDIIGKVLLDIPHLGFLFDFARQPIGFLLLVLPPAFLILYDEVEKIAREVRRLRPKKKNDGVSRAAVGPIAQRDLLSFGREETGKYMDVKPPQKVVVSPAANVQTPGEGGSGSMVTIGFALVLGSAVFGLGTMGSTISYFNDHESILGNIFRAIALDVSASQVGEVLTFADGRLVQYDGVLEVVFSEEGDSAPVRYTVRSEQTGGVAGLCESINVSAPAPFAFDGPITILEAVGVPNESSMSLALTLNDGAYLPGDECAIDLVVTAYETEATEGGYTDEERIPLIFLAPGELFGARFRALIGDLVGETVIEEGSETPEGTSGGSSGEETQSEETNGTEVVTDEGDKESDEFPTEDTEDVVEDDDLSDTDSDNEEEEREESDTEDESEEPSEASQEKESESESEETESAEEESDTSSEAQETGGGI